MINNIKIDMMIIQFKNKDIGIVIGEPSFEIKLNGVTDTTHYSPQDKTLNIKKHADSVQLFIYSGFKSSYAEKNLLKNITNNEDVDNIRFCFEDTESYIDYTVGDTYYTYE